MVRAMEMTTMTSAFSTRLQLDSAMVLHWQHLAATGAQDAPRTRALLAQILLASEPLIRQFFRQILASDSLGELDDLVNRTLERISRKLATYDATRSTYISWLKYQCVRPVFKQHLTEIGYRTVRLDQYIAGLEERLSGQQRPATHIVHRLADTLSPTEARAELHQMRRLQEKGRLVILRRDPRRVTCSLNTPVLENTLGEDDLLAPAPEAETASESLLRRGLRLGLERLSERERTAIVGVYFAQRPRKEIAREVGVSAARLGQLIRQGLKRLREILGDDYAAYLTD